MRQTCSGHAANGEKQVRDAHIGTLCVCVNTEKMSAIKHTELPSVVTSGEGEVSAVLYKGYMTIFVYF